MSAGEWLARRIGGAVAVWVVISLLAFLLGVMAPGDPARMILLRRTGDPPSEVEVQRLRRELGLDRPFAERYAAWVGRAVRGDLGRTYRTGEPVVAELGARFPATLALAGAALVAGLLLSIPLACLSAAYRDGVVDHAARAIAMAGVSIPSYLLAYLLLLLFAVTLGLLPTSGAGGVRHLVLPALTLALASAASTTRMLRGNLLDELREDYARTARAKGASARSVLTRHALRNALLPVVTISATRFGRLLGEAAIVETVFAWPGIGRWMVESILDRDYPAIQGFVLYIATLFVGLHVLVDLAYRALDPRVRVGVRLRGR